MANSKRRCKECREFYSPKELVRSGLGTLCVDCIPIVYKKQTQKARAKMVEKKQANGFTPELKQTIRERDENRCRLCGKRATLLEVHHIVFRSHKVRYENEGGEINHPSNLITLCRECHKTKAHGKNPQTYARLLRKAIWNYYVGGSFIPE